MRRIRQIVMMLAVGVAMQAMLKPVCAESALPEWERAANGRIEEHRKGNFTVRVNDAAGQPMAGVPVRVEMVRHAFPFGSAINAGRLARTQEGDPYREWAKKLFNRGTLENHYKWRWQEDPEGRARADAATQWMSDNGLDIHAHVLVWASFKYAALPTDVLRVLKDEEMALEDKRAFLHRRTLEHIREVASHYRGRVSEWDVLNEQFSEHEITKAMHPDTPVEEQPALVEWFKAAREADADARLYVNDFGILVGDHTEHKDSYERLICFLIDKGAPLGGIGMQGHYVNGWQRRTPEQLLQTLDRFAQFGLPIQITEFDMWGKGWAEKPEETEQAQADFMRQFYITMFSHPAVNGITMWGFWDGQHWMDNAPLFREDWSPRPGLDVYQDLIFDRWWTREQGVTDAEGEFHFRGFFGDYQATADYAGSPRQVSGELRHNGAVLTLTPDR